MELLSGAQLARFLAEGSWADDRNCSFFQNFRKREEPRKVDPKFLKKNSWICQFHYILLLEFQEWFFFRQFDTFRIFWKFSNEISVPICSCSEIRNFLVEWKAPPSRRHLDSWRRPEGLWPLGTRLRQDKRKTRSFRARSHLPSRLTV